MVKYLGWIIYVPLLHCIIQCFSVKAHFVFLSHSLFVFCCFYPDVHKHIWWIFGFQIEKFSMQRPYYWYLHVVDCLYVSKAMHKLTTSKCLLQNDNLLNMWQFHNVCMGVLSFGWMCAPRPPNVNPILERVCNWNDVNIGNFSFWKPCSLYFVNSTTPLKMF